MLVASRAKDAWVLQGILTAFIVFSLLLGFGLLLGQSRLAVPNAAIALGLLAIIPSVKYGFVYGEYDAIGHYSTAVVIARTGSLAENAWYTRLYSGTPLIHIFLAMTGLTAGLPVEVVIVFVLFLVHFVAFVLVAESVRRIFPRLDRRLIVFFAMMTLPVIDEFTGTVYGLLMVAVISYLWSRTIEVEGKSRWLIPIIVVMVSIAFSHFVTTLYVFAVLACYGIFVLIMRQRRALAPTANEDAMLRLIPIFFTIFLWFFLYAGQGFMYLARFITIVSLVGSPLPSSAGQFSSLDLIQIFLLKYSRELFSMLTALAISTFILLRHWKTLTFLRFWSLLAGSLLIGVPVTLGIATSEIYRFLAYGSLVAPYFLCSVLSRRKDLASLLNSNTARIRLIKATMLVALVLSMVAAYPITPLYPKSGGNPILEDNSVNSIYAVSGLDYFASVYSSGRVLTSDRIFWQLFSLHPELMHLAYNTISPGLDHGLTSPAALNEKLVLFDAGGKSGTATVAVRAFLAGNLRNKLGIVYTNGLFYIAIG